jgi:hypothetical protein
MNNLSNSEFDSNPNNTNQESLNSPDDWQLRMAYLVGLDDDLQNIDEDINNLKNDLKSDKYDDIVPISSDETNIDVDEAITSESNKPRTSLATNPFAKVVFVGAGTLIVVGFAGIFLSQIMSEGNQKLSLPTSVKKNTQETQINEPNPQAEIELLKTKLALSDQAKAVKLAQIQLKHCNLDQKFPLL